MSTRPKTIQSSRRTRAPQGGKTNIKTVELPTVAVGVGVSSPSVPSPVVSGRAQTTVGGSRPRLRTTTNPLTGTVKLVQPTARKNTMATYQPSILDNPNTWGTETRTKIGHGEYHDNYDYLDLAEEKETFIKTENQKIMFNRARKRLRELALLKFGSVNNMFKMFDYDGSGTVSLEEFSRGLKRRNLEPLFGREQQRILFQHIDTDGNEELDVQEFLHFLGGGASDLDTSRSTMSKFGRPPPKKDDKKMHPSVQRVKDMIVDRLVARRRMHKMDDSQKCNSEYLIQIFKQWDDSMTGYLTPDEFVSALGPKHLNLGISKTDMDKVLTEVDADHNGEISYKEFAKFIQVHDIDPEYNPFFDSRVRGLNSLKRIANKPWQWQKETDKALAHQQRMFDHIENDVNLSNSTKNLRVKEEQFVPAESNFMRTRPHTVGGKLAPESLKKTLSKVSSSQELFEEMRSEKAAQLAAICPRFIPLPPTDWKRTGCGGDGVDPKATGMYQHMTESTTTTNDYYPPLMYIPNQPIKRNLISDAQKGFMAKKLETSKRKKRTDSNFRVIMERVKMQETMEHMNHDQKLKEKSQQMLRYYRQIYATDAKLQVKAEGFRSKKHPKFAHRMWGGSDQSPFHVSNLHHQRVEFRTTSSDFGAHHKRSPKKGMGTSSSASNIFGV